MSRPRRDYGTRHKRVRAALMPFAYGHPCQHCGQPMLPEQELHLDHTPDGLGYRGMVHAFCNMSEGGRRGAARIHGARGGVFPRRAPD
jgi:hypothetical protein